MMVWLVILFSPWKWLQRLGGIGLIALGLADGSVVPLPGSLDALTIILAGSKHEWWPYYAVMATIGSVLGGYLTFRIGRKGGKESLEKKLSKKRLDKVFRTFEKGGWEAIVIPALLPPPVPLVPFVLAAGALDYPTRKFLIALTVGRGIRFGIVAYLASIYGKEIFGFFHNYYMPILWSFVGLVVVGSIGAAIYFVRKRRQNRQSQNVSQPAPKDA